MINSKKIIQKFLLIRSSTKNWYDFLLFCLGIKNNVEVHLKNHFKINFNKNDRKNLLTNPKFRYYKALAIIYLLQKRGIITSTSESSHIRVELQPGKFIDIPSDHQKIQKFDPFLETLYHLANLSSPDFLVEEMSQGYLQCVTF